MVLVVGASRGIGLEFLLAMTHGQIEDRGAVESAVGLIEAGFDFVDALHHASYRNCDAVATFDDRRFARRAARRDWRRVS